VQDPVCHPIASRIAEDREGDGDGREVEGAEGAMTLAGRRPR
jgi:hypothetical protein